MLPCLECAAFRTWVMPSLCNVFLFCATALWNIKENTENREEMRKDESRTTYRANVSSAELVDVSLQQTQNTHTFPMYRLGQTSSTGVSSNVQESRMSCNSLMGVGSCCRLLFNMFSLQNDPQSDPSTVPAICAHSPFTGSLWTAHWETPAGGCSNAARLQN